MKKVPVSKFAFLLLLFSLICFLMYQEYQDYQNLFSLEGKDSDIADFVPFKNVKVHKDVLNPLTRMSKSAGRDLVELKPLYGYLETQEIRDLSNTCYEKFVDGYSIEFASKYAEEVQKMSTWLEANAYKYGFVLEDCEGHFIYTYVGVKEEK